MPEFYDKAMYWDMPEFFMISTTMQILIWIYFHATLVQNPKRPACEAFGKENHGP